MNILEHGKPVVVCTTDKNMEVGLHVTLLSLLANLSDKKRGVTLHLFLEGFTDHDLKLLRRTLDVADANYEIFLHQISLDMFRGFRSFHGDFMNYARLVLPDILKGEQRFLYLDSDLVVGVDVAVLYNIDMQNLPLAASSGGTVAGALENKLLTEIGLAGTAPYFNSGVLLFNAGQWRTEDLTKKCLNFCEKYKDQLVTPDQTVLNAILNKRTFYFPQTFNFPTYPTNKSMGGEAQGKIIHFLGSPKPWDLFGNFIHGNYQLFGRHFAKTSIKSRTQFQPRAFVRALRWRRSYLR